MATAIRSRSLSVALLTLGLLAFSGCASMTTQMGLESYEIPQGDFANAAPLDRNGESFPSPHAPPAELAKITLPDYIVEPPDILLIEGIRLTPKTPYEIGVQDILQIVVLGTTPDRPIQSQYLVEPSGAVNLGPGYGTVNVAGLTTDEAAEKIRLMLLRELNSVEVAVSLWQTAGQLLIAGEHLVAPDGTVTLGIYGRVYIAGLSMDQAREAVEERLSEYFEDPKVSLDIFVYNSKFFYVINSGAGLGDQVIRIPITGNETVLDAMAQIGGLGQQSSSKIWISRPAPAGVGAYQVLPVDWQAITRGAATSTNYQLLPGDRLFIAENRLIAWSNLISVFIGPFERIMGFTLLGGQTVQTLQRFPEGFRQF